MSIDVPSIPEQVKIVAQIENQLSQLDSAVETLKKTKQQIEVYRQAVLKEAFDNNIVNQVTLSDLCSEIVDCPHSTPKWTKEGKLCLRTTNFQIGYLDLSEKNFVDQETFDLRNKRLVPLPGDIVYSREGAILGIACIIPDNTYVCLGQRMMLLRTSDNLRNRFLMHYLNSPKVTSYIKKMTGGSASPHVNVRDIKALKIPLLSMSQQQQIAKAIDSKLSLCESIGNTVNQSLQQAEALRQSILKQAFEG
jgi:type I restriction enzyme S subunit